MCAHAVVYSTDKGRICPKCLQQEQECVCRRNGNVPAGGADGVIRVSREKKGRGGKTVTCISGLKGQDAQAVALELKRKFGCGGTVKPGIVELQGDNCERAVAELQKMGFNKAHFFIV